MTAKEAVDRLRADPSDREAWAVVDALLAALARKVTSTEELRERAIARVRAKLEDQLLSDDLEEIHSPPAYFSKALRWRVKDVVRADNARQRALQKAQLVPPSVPEPEPFSDAVLATLEAVAERAITRRDPWQREHLVRAWGQLKRLQLEDVSLRRIVAEDEGLDPADGEAVERAVQRAHKAHQRARAALGEALEWMVGRGLLDAETAADARAALARLKRRQDRPSTSVTGTPRNMS